MTTLFKIDNGDIVPVRRQTLASEEVLEFLAEEFGPIKSAEGVLDA